MRRLMVVAALMVGCGPVWVVEGDAWNQAKYHQESIFCFKGAGTRKEYDDCMKRVENKYDLTTVAK
jgi:hypothetical protein